MITQSGHKMLEWQNQSILEWWKQKNEKSKEKDRKKQKKEIQEEIIRWGKNADKTGNYRYTLSEHLIDNGYCKASEVAGEIFREIEAVIRHYGYFDAWELDILKKKYNIAKEMVGGDK